jgi:HAD superfamily hydrolase (TIGR01490 family)
VEAAEVSASGQTAAAFFDVDNTVLRGASIFHLARGLHRRRLITTRDIVSAGWNHAYYRLAGVEDLAAVADARASALSFIAGHRVEEIEALSRDIFDESMASRIWPETRALAQRHLDSGQRVWLVTAAPIEIATIIARRLGLTGALGTVAEDVDGVYTGRLVGDLLHGQAKAAAVRSLAEREGLDLDVCSAYSDSYNDLPMLSLVGNPFVINPDAKLRQYARQRGWPLRDFRTGRRAAKLGLATASSAGVVAGAFVGVQTVRRRLLRAPSGTSIHRPPVAVVVTPGDCAHAERGTPEDNGQTTI